MQGHILGFSVRRSFKEIAILTKRKKKDTLPF